MDDKGLVLKVERHEAAKGRFLGDPTRIGQILSNLLSNAVKFTEQGQVTLRISQSEAPDGDRLIFEVEDTGVGFSADQAARLFDRFSQADETIDRKSVVEGKSVDLGGRRRLKKKHNP